MNFNKLTNKRNGETFTKGSYNGIEILRRDLGGYINATKLCSQFNKQFRKIQENKSWKEYLEAFTEENTTCWNSGGCFIYQLNDGIPNEIKEVRGIYIHPGLVNYVAFWASVKYAVKVGKIMDSINDKVHEKLNENNLPDTVENAKPIFENEVRKITEPQKAYEQNYCWGVRDSPYSLDPNEIDDLLRDKREYDLKKIEFENAEKKLNEWGKRFIEKYCD